MLRVASIDPDLSDDAVAAFARSSGRILITDDKEFGERALLRGELPDGVVLVRLPGAESSSDKDARVAAVIAEMGEAVGRALVVITPERVRSRRLQGG